MEEIQQLHNLNLEWGCITNLMDKISNIEDSIEGGWEELVDMVADAAMEEGEAKTEPEKLFFTLYQFLFRLYYRLKNNPEKRPFNIITTVEHNGTESFMVQNYNYSMFKWLRACGFEKEITNDFVIIAKDKLTDKHRRAFERKAA